MTSVVLDASVFLASVYPEDYTPQARQLIQQLEGKRTTIHAPALLRYELVAVTRKAVYQSRIASEEAELALTILLSYPVMLHFDEALLRSAYQLATQFQRPTAYDTQYLAVAQRVDAPFWTTDERLYNALRGRLPAIYWLGTLAGENGG